MNIFLKSSRVKTLTLVSRGCTILNLIPVSNNVYLHLSVCNGSQINTAQKIPALEGFCQAKKSSLAKNRRFFALSNKIILYGYALD